MSFRMPTPVQRPNSTNLWLRMRVPEKYRPIVGRSEVWRSLETDNRREALARCARLSADLRAEWEEQLMVRRSGGAVGDRQESRPGTPTTKEVYALAGECYRDYLALHSDNPGNKYERQKTLEEHERRGRAPLIGIDRQWKLGIYRGPIQDFLTKRGISLDEASLLKFAEAFYEARGHAESDLVRHASGDFSESPHVDRYPAPTPRKVVALECFDKYAKQQALAASTRERWKPVFEALAKHLKHDDLARVTKKDIVEWKNALLVERLPNGKTRSPRTVKDVYIAALKAVLQFAVDESELPANEAVGVVVRGVKDEREDDEKGFEDRDAATILRATLAPPSRKISVEMAAARRWVPWICAYTGARVNEITSLTPMDIGKIKGVDCFILPKERTKTRKSRRIPLHPHLKDQGFLAYVEQRRKLGKPLFYDPERSQGRPGSHPHYQKVGERLAEWVREMDVDHRVWPNHGWRHRWMSQSRDLGMHPQIADFIQGRGNGSISAKYGSKWVSTLEAAVKMIPRYEVEHTDRSLGSS